MQRQTMFSSAGEMPTSNKTTQPTTGRCDD
jgi:hypothetical protein